MKSKFRLLAAVLVAGGTMFAAQSRPFVNNGAAGYGSGSNTYRTAANYNQRDNNSHRNDNRRSGFDRDRRDDRRFDNRFGNRREVRSRAYIDDCRR